MWIIGSQWAKLQPGEEVDKVRVRWHPPLILHGGDRATIDLVKRRHQLIVEALAERLALAKILDHAKRVLDLATELLHGSWEQYTFFPPSA